MKKRNLLLALVMAMVLLVAGCGKEEKTNPFLGKWTGTLDYTEFFTNSMVAGNASIKEFVKFDDLEFTFVFEFTEEKISLHVDETSKTAFIENVKTGVANMIDAMAENEAGKNGITVDEVYENMGVTRDDYVAYTIENLKLDDMVSAMTNALELSGSYEYDDEQIVVLYDDNTYESMKYTLGMEDLTITISDGTNSFAIPCVKAQ